MLNTYDDDSDSEVYEILGFEIDNQDEDKEHLKYYLGICVEDDDGNLLLGNSIQLKTFFNRSLYYILYYIDYDNAPNQLEIMQLHIAEDLTYNVVLKTFWLKIVQRTWRRIFNLRQITIQKRKSVFEQEYFRINGRYTYTTSYLPRYSESIPRTNKQK